MSYGHIPGSAVALGEIGGGRERPPCIPSRIGSAVQADVHSPWPRLGGSPPSPISLREGSNRAGCVAILHEEARAVRLADLGRKVDLVECSIRNGTGNQDLVEALAQASNRQVGLNSTSTPILWSHGTIRPTAKNPDPERRRCMGIYKVKDRRGRRRYVVSKYWPNGSGRLRMYAPNYRSAQALQTRIESSILDGTWKQLKQELAGGTRTIWTVHSFYERFFEEYCRPRMRSRRRYALSFKSLNAMLGNIPLKEFRRKDLYRYVAKRKEQVQPATVNRDIAAISKLFSYALECGEVDTHPLVRFPKLKEPK